MNQQTFNIDPEFKALIPPLSSEEYAQLEANILDEGCREALVVWSDGDTDYLLDGHNRFEICQKHGIKFWTLQAPASIKTRDDAKVWIIDNQRGRRNLGAFVLGELALAKKAIVAEQAKANQVQHGGTAPGKGKTLCPNLDEVNDPIDTKKVLAKEAGISHGTLAKVETVLKSGNEELIDKARKREISVDAAYKEVKREEKRAEHASKVEQAKSNPAPPAEEGPFDIILADPPWQYDHQEAENRAIENHYNTGQVMDIAQHAPYASEDSILFLWATAPKICEALQVMDEWGFKYRTHAVWDKGKIGMGYWFRGRHELLLVGVKGKPGTPPECERVASIFEEPRREHSQKPDCVYEWIERAFPLKSKLEMYCRNPRSGWVSWGNEVSQ